MYSDVKPNGGGNDRNPQSYTPNPDRPFGNLEDVKITDKQFAVFSHLAYKGFEPGPNMPIEEDFLKKALGETGWEEDIMYRRSDSNGFQAKVFINRNKKELVIALRGTDDWKDIALDATMISRGLITTQHKSMDKLIQDLLKDPRYKDYQFTTTGHSLGGNLAMYAGVKYSIPTITFNGSGFDDPEMDDAVYSGKYNDLIRNYNFGNDPIGAYKNKPGETYNVKVDGSNREVILQENTKLFNYRPLLGIVNFDDDGITFPVISDHGIINFTGLIDPEKEAKEEADKIRNNTINSKYDYMSEEQYQKIYQDILAKKKKEHQEYLKQIEAMYDENGNIKSR